MADLKEIISCVIDRFRQTTPKHLLRFHIVMMMGVLTIAMIMGVFMIVVVFMMVILLMSVIVVMVMIVMMAVIVSVVMIVSTPAGIFGAFHGWIEQSRVAWEEAVNY